MTKVQTIDRPLRNDGVNYANFSSQEKKTYVHYHNQQRKLRKDKRAAVVNRFKQMKGCADCGAKGLPAYVYDLDHLDPQDKIDHVSVLLNMVRPWKIIREEVLKCEVVCANCHRIRTETRRADDRPS
jgi:hypothetical protein